MGSYLVTGAAGFIGSAVAKRLIAGGHDVVTIDNLSTGTASNIPEGILFFQADCQDERVYKQIPQDRYDAVFHIAGQSSGEISFDDPVYDLRTNSESTLRILKFCMENGCDRLVFASTMSVYGVQPVEPVNETASTFPTSFYGIGKLASEHYLRIYEEYGIHSTALRLFNVFGPGQNLLNFRQGMVSIFLAQILSHGHIEVKGSGERFRDFIYIDDVVDTFLACLGNQQSQGEIINVGSGVPTTVNQLVQSLISAYGIDVPVEFSGGTPGDIHGIYSDSSKMKVLLGMNSQVSFSEGIRSMVQWAKDRSREERGNA